MAKIFSLVTNVHIINIQGKISGMGHSSFRKNSEASSDLAIAIREGSKTDIHGASFLASLTGFIWLYLVDKPVEDQD
jgi:hypothetical protein